MSDHKLTTLLTEHEAASINYGVFVGMLSRDDLPADDRVRLLANQQQARERMREARKVLMEESDARPSE